MKKANSRNTTLTSIYPAFLIIAIILLLVSRLAGQNCPNGAPYCADAPLLCGLNQLNGNSACSLLPYSLYVGDRCNDICWGNPDNNIHYVFTTDGKPFTITCTFSNCQNPYGSIHEGMNMTISSECCGGIQYYCAGIYEPYPPVASFSLNGQLPSCKIYWLTIDGMNGTYCDYTLSVDGGAANVPLLLKNINNDPNNIIEINRGYCGYKFKVDPKDAPCEGYMEWTLDGVPINDHDKEVFLSFPDEGDFQLCVLGYIGLPNFNCGQSNQTCTKIEIRQENRVAAAPRYLCNEQKGYKWFKETINSSGIYKQTFQEPCNIFDSTVEFVLLAKPQPAIVDHITCSKEAYYDPVQKQIYNRCIKNHTIPIPKSSEVFGCDSSYILNVAFIDLKNTMHLECKNGNMFMIPQIINYADTCSVIKSTKLSYTWFEKVNNNFKYLSDSRELPINKKADYQLTVLVEYTYGNQQGQCSFNFDETIDEDSYLQTPNTGSLLGKKQVCKGDLECYSIYDIVKNPFSFSWTVDQGTIVTPDPNNSDTICINWDKYSLSNSGNVCVRYSDSCARNLTACLNVEFGKSNKAIAGPDQQVGGVLGTKLNAQGQKGLWTYAGGAGTVIFNDPMDPKTRVRVSRFGSYMFRWTIMEGDCEIYDTVTVNFYIEFPQLEGEYYKQTYIREEINPFGDIHVDYIDNNLNFRGKTLTFISIRFHVMNLNGQILYSDELQSTGNDFAKNIDLSLMPGIYYLVLENNSDFKVSRFTVF